jgi:DNA-binding CsgD family transcriptional regulator
MVDVTTLLKGPADRFIRKYDRNRVIFDEGDHGDTMYFIYSGKVRLSTKYHGREITLAVIGPGDFFGEMALIDMSTRTARAVAEDDNTQLIELDRAKFLDLVGARPSFALIIMQTLCGRVRDRWKVLQDLKAEVTRTRGKVELEIKWPDLEGINTALKVVLDQMKKEKMDSEARVVSNVREFILPYLEKLKMSKLNTQQEEYVSVIEENLRDIIFPFMEHLTLGGFKLTPTEMKIANLIKDGKTTKEIADLLNLSTATIDFHRNNIRSKLGLTKKRESLKTHLQNLSCDR